MSAVIQHSETVDLDADLLAEAKALKVDLNKAAEEGIALAVRRAKWAEENAEFIRSSNEYVEKYGLPLEKYRLF